jgi:creatinine amidohydrolase
MVLEQSDLLPTRRAAHQLATALAITLTLGACTSAREPQGEAAQDGSILKLEELTYTDIDALDREKTVFVLTFGNLEEHGPHLPVGSDYFQATAVRDGAVGELRRRHPDYKFVLVPTVPLGEGGFNDLARQFDHVGAFGIRFETLRDVAVDLGAAIGAKGFKNIWLIHGHGMPFHNIAFSEAAAFVSERYNVRMTNLTSLMFGQGLYSAAVLARHLGADWERQYGMSGHADMAETAANLFIRGDLVKPEYATLPPFVVADLDALGRLYERTGFRGYMGAPAKASKEIGQELVHDFIQRTVDIAERALAGEDLSGLPVWPAVLPSVPELDESMRLLQERYVKQTSELAAWLASQRSTRR